MLHPFQIRLANIWRKFGKEGGKGLELDVRLMGRETGEIFVNA